jgi:hypothetical protein
MLILVLLIGCFIGFCGMAILSGRAYEKGFADAASAFEKAYEDGKQEGKVPSVPVGRI